MLKKGFTIIEVSILFVIFLIVALLVAPMSLDDTMQAKNTSRWRTVQQDFSNIFQAIDTRLEEENSSIDKALETILSNEIKNNIDTYKISFMNGSYPNSLYRFKDYKVTYSDAVIATKMFEDPNTPLVGMLMYDVNGKNGPNVWGKDVFGLNIYEDRFEPFCKADNMNAQKQDCSRSGTGLCCSNYYLIGGKFD